MNFWRQAGKRMREAAVDAHFTFTSCFFLCWPFLFSQLLFAPLLEIIVKFKVKAYASLHNDLYLKTEKICHKFCKRKKETHQGKQEVTIFTVLKHKTKQLHPDLRAAGCFLRCCRNLVSYAVLALKTPRDSSPLQSTNLSI